MGEEIKEAKEQNTILTKREKNELIRKAHEKNVNKLALPISFKGSNMYKYLDDDTVFDVDSSILRINCVAKIESGDVFGEMGILSNKPRNATVICCGDVVFGTLSKEVFKAILKEFERQQIDKKVKYFNQKL